MKPAVFRHYHSSLVLSLCILLFILSIAAFSQKNTLPLRERALENNDSPPGVWDFQSIRRLEFSPGRGVRSIVNLNIPPRKQWDNDGGYCGACTIQQIAAYYGTYVSQSVCRLILDPQRRLEVLVAVNEEAVLDALGFRTETWDWHQMDLWQEYLRWIKNHVDKGSPVMITTFMQGGSDPDYDHIMPAVGVKYSQKTVYDGEDELTFNDNFTAVPHIRTFQSLPDTRYVYNIPTRTNYGCAVPGTKDINSETIQTHLHIHSWEEPNVSLGNSPVLMNGTLTIGPLEKGKFYSLLRYNRYQDVPDENFTESQYSTIQTFEAIDTSHQFPVQFMSDGFAAFRCVPKAGLVISGTVQDAEGIGGTGIPTGLQNVIMNGLPGDPVTNNQGDFQVTVPPDWSGYLIPQKDHYSFSPPNRSFNRLQTSQSEQNFSAIRQIYAPLDFQGKRVLNRSLSQSEYIDILSWNSNPLNININGYRIYLVGQQTSQFLAEVSSEKRTFVHRNIDGTHIYVYRICAVNSAEREGAFVELILEDLEYSIR